MRGKKSLTVLYYIILKKSSVTEVNLIKTDEKNQQNFLGKNVQFIVKYLFSLEDIQFMKIKVAILTPDIKYLERITNILGTRYSDSLELYSFTDSGIALKTVTNSKINIMFVDIASDVDINLVPDDCDFIWLVDQSDIETYRGRKAVCKFQTVDLFYKQILNIYSEHQDEVIKRYSVGNCKTIAFLPVSGGSGASSLAAASAINLAQTGKRVLYLNLERLGSSDVFFEGNGSFSLSDVFLALQSKNANLSLKIESCVKQDKSGVYFFSQTKSSLDMFEMSSEHYTKLLLELINSDRYDVIVIDTDFGLDAKKLEFLDKVSRIVWVGDGSETSNSKLIRAYEALEVIEQSRGNSLSNRIGIIYNKFSNKTCKTLERIDLKNIAGIPKYEHLSSGKVVESLSKLNIYSQLI